MSFTTDWDNTQPPSSPPPAFFEKDPSTPRGNFNPPANTVASAVNSSVSFFPKPNTKTSSRITAAVITSKNKK